MSRYNLGEKQNGLSPAPKPFLKWAGGKRALLPQLSKYFHDRLLKGEIIRYIEPFIGGGAVFFELYSRYKIAESYLFDINPEIVILYNVIKSNVQNLIAELRQIDFEYKKVDQSELYYELRDEYNTFDKNIDASDYDNSFIRRAALTLFLNKTCFNGLYRVNSSGYFNVPFGKYRNPKILDEDNLYLVSEALKSATITQSDFKVVLDYSDKDTFIYFDPPYRPVNKSSFNSYAMGSFDDGEQVRLKDIFDKAHKLGAFQMLSNSDPKSISDDNFFDDLYSDYNIYRVSAKRSINSNPNLRGVMSEIVITNY